MSTIVREILEGMWSNNLDHKHALHFIEDLKINGDKEAVCQVCEEPPLGSGYKCSQCNFLCHKSCFDLPHEIQHPFHPNHNLSIHAPQSAYYCVGCGKCCGRCFFYWCKRRGCNFQIDIKCSSRWRVNKDDCHRHAYVPFLKNIPFTCEACGEEGKDIPCLYCSICQLLIHADCASFSRIINVRDHDHTLTLNYSAHQVKEHASILCELCNKEVKTEYAIYYCQKCNYVAHLKCTRWRDLQVDRNAIIVSAPAGFIGNVTGLIKYINRVENQKDRPPEIKHFSHQHDLIINYEEVKNDKLCDGCMQLISPPFYSCAQCNFFLHSICAKLPIKARHLHVALPSILLSQAPFSNGLFQCCCCQQYRHGFAYQVEGTRYLFDIQCFALQETLQHEAHQHLLSVAENLGQKCKFCEEKAHFVCSPCNFFLGFTCATLPPIANHEYDEHPLELTVEDKSNEYYCLICEQERDSNQLFYYCAKCDFAAHLQCVIGKYPYIKFGKTYNDEHHQHPLTFVRKTEFSPSCDVCGDQFDDEVSLECTQCKLTVHPSFGDMRKDCVQKLGITGHLQQEVAFN